MIKPLFALVLSITCCTAVAAQTTRIDHEPKIDKIFSAFSRSGSPGAAVAVYQDGQIVFSKGYGLAHLEHDVPITPETVFYLGSVSKQFVAAAILLLVQDKKLSLDDDIRKHVPELPDYGSAISVRHLLHHTSGLRDYLGLLQLAGRPIDQFHDDAGIIEMLAKQKALNFEPGSKYAYSNSGYFLLNVIVERVSGKTLREFTAEQIFEPLEMANTHFHDDYQHIIKDRAMGYFPGGRRKYKQFMNTFDRVGSGGVYSNVRDLFHWDQNFYGHKVGGEALYQAQHQHGKLNNGDEIEYAAGLVHGAHRGLQVVSHGGALGGYRSELIRFPDQHFGVAVLANISNANPGQLARRVADLYLAEDYPPTSASTDTSSATEVKRVELTADEMKAFEGRYWDRENAVLREIKYSKGKLYYVRSRANRTELGATGPNSFVMLGLGMLVPVEFSTGKMTVTAPGEGTVVYESYQPLQVTKEQLAELNGQYYSDELLATFELDSPGNLLIVKTPNQNIPFGPIVKDVFAMPGARALLQIERNGDGQVKGFSLDAGGIRGIVFERPDNGR